MVKRTAAELFESETACRNKAASLRTIADKASSPAAKALTLEIAAEWDAKGTELHEPRTRRLTPKTTISVLLARLLRRYPAG
jgi:hypothetical protein